LTLKLIISVDYSPVELGGGHVVVDQAAAVGGQAKQVQRGGLRGGRGERRGGRGMRGREERKGREEGGDVVGVRQWCWSVGTFQVSSIHT
jgi:hypothetical protein